MTGTEPWRRHFPFRSRYADIGGMRCHYVDEGAGPPTVLVHGNPTWSFYWRELIQAIAGNGRAIAPDHIGMGFSDRPDRSRYPFTLERRIQDFGIFVRQLELSEPITLIVHDWGGAIGLGWAVDNPDLVSRIVVTNTAAFGLPAGKRMPPALALARSYPLGSGLVVAANAFVRGAIRLGVKTPMAGDIQAGYLAPYLRRADRISILEFVKDIPLVPTHRSYDTLAAVDRNLVRLANIPMMICWGARDFVFDDHILNEWERRFPSAEVHRFADAGHFVLEDAGDDIVPLVLEFMI